MLVLLGAHLAEHDRIDDFEMRRVRGQRQVHIVAVELAVRRRTQVILHVARAFDIVGRSRAALELVEQRAVWLAHHLRQDVQPTAMRHAEHDLLHAKIAAVLDDLLHGRDQRLAAIETEAFGAGELHVAEFLEAFGLDQLVRIARLPSRVNRISLSAPSMRSWIHAFCLASEMCMNSMPSVWQ